MELKGCYRMNVNSKAFGIPILIVSTLAAEMIAVGIGISNVLILTFIL